MRRLVIFAAAIALFASTAAMASADEGDSDAEPSEALQRRAELLADYVLGDETNDDAMRAAVDEIVWLRTGDTVVGWGALFKLLQLVKATGTELSATEYMAEIRAEGGWAFGRRFKELNGSLDGTAKNLGQLKKQAREPNDNQGKKP